VLLLLLLLLVLRIGFGRICLELLVVEPELSIGFAIDDWRADSTLWYALSLDPHSHRWPLALSWLVTALSLLVIGITTSIELHRSHSLLQSIPIKLIAARQSTTFAKLLCSVFVLWLHQHGRSKQLSISSMARASANRNRSHRLQFSR
jgi:hypothetical protein